MLMRTYEHNCRTTFVDGVNPFLAVAARPEVGQPEAEPAPTQITIGRPKTTQLEILELLKDGIPRTAATIAVEIYGNQKSISTLLLKLAKEGKVVATYQRRQWARPVPVYSIWSKE